MSKKILAGVLAAASVLTMTVTASAVEAPSKTTAVTKPGTTDYETGIGVMGAELDVELPTTMAAFLNPYGAEVAVDEETTPTKSKEGIVSWAYEVVNNTEAFGIMIDVKDAKAEGTGIDIDAPGAAEAATAKTASLVLQAGATAADATDYDAAKTATAQATATTQGVFVFADTAASKSKIAYAPAAGKVYLGLTGALAKVDAAGEDLEYTDTDTIKATYTLKISPSAKTQADAFANGGAGGGGSTVTPGLNADLTQTNFTGTGITAFAKKTGANNEYNITVDSTTNGGSAIALNLTGLVNAGQTVTSKVADNANVTVAGMGMNVNVTPAAQGSSVVTITLSDNNTIVLNFTIT